jgi:hypothetical protein
VTASVSAVRARSLIERLATLLIPRTECPKGTTPG